MLVRLNSDRLLKVIGFNESYEVNRIVVSENKSLDHMTLRDVNQSVRKDGPGVNDRGVPNL